MRASRTGASARMPAAPDLPQRRRVPQGRRSAGHQIPIRCDGGDNAGPGAARATAARCHARRARPCGRRRLTPPPRPSTSCASTSSAAAQSDTHPSPAVRAAEDLRGTQPSLHSPTTWNRTVLRALEATQTDALRTSRCSGIRGRRVAVQLHGHWRQPGHCTRRHGRQAAAPRAAHARRATRCCGSRRTRRRWPATWFSRSCTRLACRPVRARLAARRSQLQA